FRFVPAVRCEVRVVPRSGALPLPRELTPCDAFALSRRNRVVLPVNPVSLQFGDCISTARRKGYRSRPKRSKISGVDVLEDVTRPRRKDRFLVTRRRRHARRSARFLLTQTLRLQSSYFLDVRRNRCLGQEGSSRDPRAFSRQGRSEEVTKKKRSWVPNEEGTPGERYPLPRPRSLKRPQRRSRFRNTSRRKRASSLFVQAKGVGMKSYLLDS
ncbi:uncharacterized protein LOC111674123, partial [Orussus abietinus]|uniref:uncharacterized protein LOC111674123 n=1 Tax=Orussus abietinus TaxID=222816 RepID=UPI000C715D09